MDDLQKVLYDVVHDFGLVTPLNLFSSIIPEYAYGGDDPYLFELNLENSTIYHKTILKIK